MILDCRIDGGHEAARAHRLLDAVTGEDLTTLLVFYADDEAGVIRRYLLRDGEFYCEPGADELAWVEEHRAIRIVPRREETPREETWRDRAPLL